MFLNNCFKHVFYICFVLNECFLCFFCIKLYYTVYDAMKTVAQPENYFWRGSEIVTSSHQPYYNFPIKLTLWSLKWMRFTGQFNDTIALTTVSSSRAALKTQSNDFWISSNNLVAPVHENVGFYPRISNLLLSRSVLMYLS